MSRFLRSTLVLVFLVNACSHLGVVGTQPDVRALPHKGGELEVDVSVDTAAAIELAEDLERHGMQLSAVWNIPGRPDLKLAIVTRPPHGDAYGPQLAAFRTHGKIFELVHESDRLFDDDFIYPTFVRFPDRTLLLADHGSEDAYGVLAWSFEDGPIRDLGELPIALPEKGYGFTRGAAASARVSIREGAYFVVIPGPVLLYPTEDRERLIGKKGDLVRFREVGGKLTME